MPAITVEGLDHVALRVSDRDASAGWYERLLGLRSVHEDVWERVPVMLVGRAETGLALFQARPGGRAGFAHLAFRVTPEQYASAKEILAAEAIAFEEQDHTVSRSLYFRDPDGIELELTTYDAPSDRPRDHRRQGAG